MVRWIKLKEFDPLVDTEVEPTDDYIKGTDGSLEKIAFRIRTDQNGFMRSGAEHIGSRPWILLGDSAAECLFITEGNRIGSAIEKRARDSGKNIDVLMNAMSNCTTLHALNIYVNKCIQLEPELLIYMQCGSDAEALSAAGKYWISGPGHSEKALGPIQQHNIGNDSIDFNKIEDTARIQMLNLLNSAVSTYGGRLILVTVPMRKEIDQFVKAVYSGDVAAYEKNLAAKKKINQITRVFARQNNIMLVDAELLSNQVGMFYDTIHLNETGSLSVSNFIADALCVS